MYKPKPFIQQQLKSTLIRGFQKTQSLLSYLKTTWFLLNNSIFALARNPKTQPEILALLVNGGDWLVRVRVAGNLNTPPETLERLSYDEDPDVRYRVAENLNTSPETLVRLANDGDSYVRYGVAYNPNTSPETLVRLANDEDSGVRYCVAWNPNTPQYLKDYLKINQFLIWHRKSRTRPIYRLQ